MKARLAPTAFALSVACVAASSAAWGQTSPSRIIPPSRPDQAPPIAKPPQEDPSRRATTPAAPTVRPFVVHGIEVAGSSLPQAAFAAATRPFIGQTLAADGLQKVSDAVAAVHADSPIALYTVVIPDQDFAGGVIRLIAIEGYVQQALIEDVGGSRTRGLVERYVLQMREERPLTRRSLQRYVSLIRDIPGLNAQVDLINGDRPGAVRVRVKGRPKPVQAGIGVNNRGTAYLGRTQVQADLYLNSMIRPGDQTRLTVAAPTQASLFRYYATAYSTPVGTQGLGVSANAGYLVTRPANTGLKGRAKSAGVQVSYPFIRSFDRDLYGALSLDGVNSDNALLGFRFSDDRTRAIRASLAYNHSKSKHAFSASGALSQGLSGLGARTFDPESSKLAFTKVNGRGGYSQMLSRTLVLRLAGAGQYSGDRLPAAEQFALGGEEFGRAYEAAIIAGDYGYAGSAELALRPTGLPDLVDGSEAYGFVDGGKVWYRGRYGFPTASQHLASVGAGVRVLIAERAVVQVEAAKGLNDPVYFLDRQRWRGVFNLRTAY